MKPTLITIAAFTALTIPVVADDKADKEAAMSLQGEWRVVSAKFNGSSLDKPHAEKLRVTFDGDKIQVFVAGSDEAQSARFRLDSNAEPKRIDFVEPTRDVEGRELIRVKMFRAEKSGASGPREKVGSVEGIYKLEGDSLTLCWRTHPGADMINGKVASGTQVRPRVFGSELYNFQFLYVLKRAKSEK